MKIINVPTGKIFTIQRCSQPGKSLECLSIADYGKERNIKADFLGLTKDINGVENGNPMPFSEKWVTTISTQYGCSMKCKFCDVPNVGPGINATVNDMNRQIAVSILNTDCQYTKRFNLHYARMGEPTFNFNVIENAFNIKSFIRSFIYADVIHPVVSTMLPKNNKDLEVFLFDWCEVKNKIFNGEAGLQFSINSTSDQQRDDMFNGTSLSLKEISELTSELPYPKGRKYTLNFALADNYEVDADKLLSLFDPDMFIVKITPIHNNTATKINNIETKNGYSCYDIYKKPEDDLKAKGFDVIVFVPSIEEDESKITCGNAILANKLK